MINRRAATITREEAMINGREAVVSHEEAWIARKGAERTVAQRRARKAAEAVSDPSFCFPGWFQITPQGTSGGVGPASDATF
jgi:hypothetical protein